MKFNLLALACALMLAFGLSMGSFAGSIADADSDGIPDQYDNCTTAANGPLAGSCSNNEDGDNDGFGNACDADFNQDGLPGLDDVGTMLPLINQPDPVRDLNCDELVGLDDLGVVLANVNVAIGPSGLSCADSVNPVQDGSCPPL